jgi:dTDP-glucose 4,6-dehydratase/UDP-glucuronate decarboxylase
MEKERNNFFLDTVVKEDCDYILKKVKTNKLKNSKVLILGGNGFIATYIQAVLVSINCNITSVSLNKPKGLFKAIYKKNKIKFIQMDLTNEKKFQKLLKNKYDFIFHCASYGQPKKWQYNQLSTINLNTNTLKFILDHSVKYKSRVLYLSSAAVYETTKNQKTINESSPLGIGKFTGEIIYANSKIIGEQLCKMYKKKYKIPVYIIRLAHTFGPGQDFKDPRFIPQVLRRALLEKKIYIYDKGKSIRTWGYIADMTIMLLNIIQYGKSLTYNVSGKNHKSFFEIAKSISKFFSNMSVKIKKKKLSFTSPKPSVLKISSKKYHQEFINTDQVNLLSALSKMIYYNKQWQKLN